jgi:hypothetical protein
VGGAATVPFSVSAGALCENYQSNKQAYAYANESNQIYIVSNIVFHESSLEKVSVELLA